MRDVHWLRTASLPASSGLVVFRAQGCQGVSISCNCILVFFVAGGRDLVGIGRVVSRCAVHDGNGFSGLAIVIQFCSAIKLSITSIFFRSTRNKVVQRHPTKKGHSHWGNWSLQRFSKRLLHPFYYSNERPRYTSLERMTKQNKTSMTCPPLTRHSRQICHC